MAGEHRRLILGLLCIACAAWMAWGNLCVGYTHVTVSDGGLPEAFDGFTIAQVSDFHNLSFGDAVVKRLRREALDLIAITGDLIDSHRTDVDCALEFVRQMCDIAPCCFVTGNHEAWVDDPVYARLEDGLRGMGVTVLRDEAVTLARGDAEMAIVGLVDPAFGYTLSVDAINALIPDGQFCVLLSHRPEVFEAYVRTEADVVLSGHAHGGQFRLPFVGGVIAPDQGFWPQYDGGVYTEGGCTMVVSRGIGNSVIPVRFNNPPEVVLIRLEK